jgi:hypothetical protein
MGQEAKGTEAGGEIEGTYIEGGFQIGRRRGGF